MDTANEPSQALLPGRRGLLVRLNAKNGMRAALLDRLNTYADGLGEEPGTEMYIVSIDPDDANIVWLYEMFHDNDAEEAHRASRGFADLMHELQDLVDGPAALLRMEPLRMAFQETLLSDDWAL